MTDLKKIRNISPQRGMPVDDKNTSSTIKQVTGESLQLYYWTEGARTIDIGETSGTLVEAQLSQNNIKNASGAMEATDLDTSLGFSSTALTTEVEFKEIDAENADLATGTGRLEKIAGSFASGQYCVDYTNGTIYGKKADNSISLQSVTYNIQKIDVAATEPIEISADDGEASTAINQERIICLLEQILTRLDIANLHASIVDEVKLDENNIN